MPVTRLPLPGVTVNDSDAERDDCGISDWPWKSGVGVLNTGDGEGAEGGDGTEAGDGGSEMSWRVGSIAVAGSASCPKGAEGAANVNVLAVGAVEIFSDTFSDEFSLKSIPKSMACSIAG